VVILSLLPALISAIRARSRQTSKSEVFPLGRSTHE
jgi:hypothetical protein